MFKVNLEMVYIPGCDNAPPLLLHSPHCLVGGPVSEALPAIDLQ